MKSILSNIGAYFAYAFQGVIAVEAAIPTAPGTTKKDAVMAGIGALAKVGEAIPEAHVVLISAMVDSIVAALNAQAWFHHVAPVPVKAA